MVDPGYQIMSHRGNTLSAGQNTTSNWVSKGLAVFNLHTNDRSSTGDLIPVDDIADLLPVWGVRVRPDRIGSPQLNTGKTRHPERYAARSKLCVLWGRDDQLNAVEA